MRFEPKELRREADYLSRKLDELAATLVEHGVERDAEAALRAIAAFARARAETCEMQKREALPLLREPKANARGSLASC